MTAEGLFVLGVIGLVTAALMSRRIGVDTAMVGGLLLLLLADQILGGNRILPIQDGLSGFSHKAVVMIGALYVVAAGLRETGGVHLIAGKLLGRPKGLLSRSTPLDAPRGTLVRSHEQHTTGGDVPSDFGGLVPTASAFPFATVHSSVLRRHLWWSLNGDWHFVQHRDFGNAVGL